MNSQYSKSRKKNRLRSILSQFLIAVQDPKSHDIYESSNLLIQGLPEILAFRIGPKWPATDGVLRPKFDFLSSHTCQLGNDFLQAASMAK